ncbi:hypothetical protein BC936DRAFT_148907 [Jimgerdemannia flammicorona]|uniref:FAD-binding domain-containing protein n=1 Tax=Jimgerdemannia flammicorona TaxID=994334 RepID=A0A433DN73_9FUNG|nr:hypothetical protein BC936DRAFT_148907 [Jimgerdemannia flammicorona]
MDVSRLGNPSHPKHDLRLLPWESQTSPSPSRIWWREHISCSANASCWGSPHLHERDSIMNPYGEGWHLDRARFDQFMRDWWGKSTMSGVRELWEKTTFQSAEKDADGRWIVTVRRTESDGDHEVVTVGCDWLIDASGRRACMARKVKTPQNTINCWPFTPSSNRLPTILTIPIATTAPLSSPAEMVGGTLRFSLATAAWWPSTRTPTIRSPGSRAGTMNFYRYCTSTPSKSERSSSSMGMSSPTAKGSRGARLHTGQAAEILRREEAVGRGWGQCHGVRPAFVTGDDHSAAKRGGAGTHALCRDGGVWEFYGECMGKVYRGCSLLLWQGASMARKCLLDGATLGVTAEEMFEVWKRGISGM